ncbi:hypothetical protein F4808DRAFT_202812 [Astrocystis sublimbata]|nr:hypothetical protein F4808DRAFT_202812 [Astrocystis sublimbata]
MSLPTQIAETIQTAHVKRDPSPRHDLNPSTAASIKEPVYLGSPISSQRQRRRYSDSLEGIDDDEDDIPLSVLERPRGASRRGLNKPQLPPMPDLRFEQSYLHSIEHAETWGWIAFITVRDQILMPLAQGFLYNLAVQGWHMWNRNAQLSGNSAGARVRRWWYGVNNWPLPASARPKAKWS